MYMNRHYLKEMFKEIRDSETGSRQYVYSDLAFILSAEIIESLTDSTIDKFAPQNIYRPIGAFNITYNPLEKYPKDRIVPTEYDSLFRKQLLRGTVHDEGAAMLGGVSGHAGLFATGNDLLKLIEMYRRGGEYGGVRVLSQEVLKEYTRVQYPENEDWVLTSRCCQMIPYLLRRSILARQRLRQASGIQASQGLLSGLILRRSSPMFFSVTGSIRRVTTTKFLIC
jgi:CubicO group peptidase (beta-lactamase class C family)